LRGLYAITSEALGRDPDRLAAGVRAALAGGARLIQYRDKRRDAPARRQAAEALLALCRERGAALIVNDDVELARAVGADGVHLGAADVPVREARRRLGDGALIGVSCSNRLERAVAAAEDGASYVAFGRFFASRTKPDAPPAELGVLRAARARLRLPICAIGGITPANGAKLIEAGADLIAAVDGVFGAPDIEAAARAYARLFVE
jgi:thiamine-phosphate pyrophosphorylase